MTFAPTPTTSLDRFLQTADIEASPAWEYVAGQIRQKPMPQAHHSRLQLKLADAINDAAEADEIAAAFPELRCTFGERSIVPDIAVLRWSKIPFSPAGALEPGAIPYPPDWTIEILSPGQSATKVIANILACLTCGTELGWLIDPGDRAIFGFRPQQELQLYRNRERLPVLSGLDLDLSVERVFQWLRMGRSRPSPQ